MWLCMFMGPKEGGGHETRWNEDQAHPNEGHHHVPRRGVSVSVVCVCVKLKYMCNMSVLQEATPKNDYVYIYVYICDIESACTYCM